MPGDKLIPANPGSPQINAELLERFLVQQTEQIAVRKDEIELEKQQDNHAYDFAQSSLAAQAKDRSEQREAARSGRRDRLIFASFVVVILGAFVMYTLYLGKDEFARETLKALVFLLTGGLGGYSIGTRKPRSASASGVEEEAPN